MASTSVVLSDEAIQQLATAIQSVTIDSTSLDAPAWVQAIGSVLAIIAAIWLSRSEAKRASASAAQERVDFVDSIAECWNLASFQLTYHCDGFDEHIIRSRENSDVRGLQNSFEAALDGLDDEVYPVSTKIAAIPLEAWPDISMATQFLRFHTIVAKTRRGLSDLVSIDAGQDPKRFWQLVDNYEKNRKEGILAADQALNQYYGSTEHLASAVNELGWETSRQKSLREAKEKEKRDAAAEAKRKKLARAKIIAGIPKDAQPGDPSIVVAELTLKSLKLAPYQLDEIAKRESLEDELALAEHKEWADALTNRDR